MKHKDLFFQIIIKKITTNMLINLIKKELVDMEKFAKKSIFLLSCGVALTSTKLSPVHAMFSESRILLNKREEISSRIVRRYSKSPEIKYDKRKDFSKSLKIFPKEEENYEIALNQLQQFDPMRKQITSFPSANKYKKRLEDNHLVCELDWFAAKPVQVLYQQEPQNPNAPVVYVGGLSMLFQAINAAENKKLSRGHSKIVFINDGQYPIYKQSGFQLHAHGTQYPDYNVGYLIRKFIESNTPFFKTSPFDLDYDNLHLPISQKVLSQPFYHLSYYLQFFFNQLHHDITSVNRVGDMDKKLAKGVMESFCNYKELNDKIVKSMNKPIVVQNGRFYFSHNLDGIVTRLKKWQEMGIPVTLMSSEQLSQNTILRINSHQPLYAFGMFGNGQDIPADGYAKPHIMETTIKYAQQIFPESFEYKEAHLQKVFLDSYTHKPYKIEIKETSGQISQMELSAFQASLGHAEVYKDKTYKQPFYRDFTATGTSTNFVLTIDLERLVQRKLGGTDDPEQVKQFILNNKILPSADLYNLHMTIFDQEIISDNGRELVKLYARATEGANFNADGFVADKRDFVNVLKKLHLLYEGEIELISAGNCTRHTWLENMPRLDGCFLNGQSGVGLSFAAFNHNKWFE